MKDNQLSPVNFSRRMTAFVIDSSIVCVIRVFLLQIFITSWLQKYIINFVNSFKFVFGDNIKPSEFNDTHLRFFMQNELFPRFIMCIIILILVGFIYNLIMLSTKWSATVGQKIVGIFTVSKNENPIKWYQVIARSFLTIFPMNMLFLLSIYQLLGAIGSVKPLSQQIFVLTVGLGALAWYDMFFFTKDKILMHGFLSGTKIVRKGEFSKGFFDIAFDLIDKIIPSLWKMVGKFKDIIKKSSKNIANENKKSRKVKKKRHCLPSRLKKIPSSQKLEVLGLRSRP